MIPASDIDVQARKLFGQEFSGKLSHANIDVGGGSYYFYDEEMQKYMVDTNISTDLYTPSILSIKKSKNQLVLAVGYVPPGSLWEMNLKGERNQPAPDFYRWFYINLLESDEQYITSVKVMTAQEIKELTDRDMTDFLDNSRNESMPEGLFPDMNVPVIQGGQEGSVSGTSENESVTSDSDVSGASNMSGEDTYDESGDESGEYSEDNGE
jgi:hypothetical protein